jgi:short-subunit dehydrogenase
MEKQDESSPPVAVITGASRGIGAAVAAELARRGYRLALLARNQAPLEETARGLGSAPEVRVFSCDLEDSSQVDSTFKDILDWAGQVDVLVNNAGVGLFSPMEEISDSTVPGRSFPV